MGVPSGNPCAAAQQLRCRFPLARRAHTEKGLPPTGITLFITLVFNPIFLQIKVYNPSKIKSLLILNDSKNLYERKRH